MKLDSKKSKFKKVYVQWHIFLKGMLKLLKYTWWGFEKHKLKHVNSAICNKTIAKIFTILRKWFFELWTLEATLKSK